MKTNGIIQGRWGRLIGLLMGASVLVCGSAFAAEIAVAPAIGVSVHPELKASANQLLIMALRDRKVDAELISGEGELDAAARKIGAAHIAQLRITRVGRKAIIQAELRKVGDAKVQWSGRLTAQTPDDLDTVTARLARGLIEGGPVEDNATIHDVTAQEQRRLRRKRANSYFGATINGQLLLDDDTAFSPGLGLFWLYDNRDLLLDLTLTIYTDNSGGAESGGGVNIGVWYPLLDEDITPYIGGGLGYTGVARSASDNQADAEAEEYYHYEKQESGSGISAFVGGGVLLGRTSSVALRADLRYVISTYDVGGQPVHGPEFAFGLGF